MTIYRRDGEEVTVSDGYLALLLNTNPYTFLGDRPFDVAPGTGLDTPLCAVVVRSLGAVTLLGLAAAALRGHGGIDDQRKVTVATEVVRAVLIPRQPVPYQVDGDYLGETGRLEFTWEPNSLRLIVPHH